MKGFFGEYCYFYIDDGTKHGFLIDPGAEPERLLSLIRKNDWIIEKILLTHGHFDHFGAVNTLRKVLDVTVIAHEDADRYLLDGSMNLSAGCGGTIIVEDTEKVRNGDVITLKDNQDFALRVIHTPGHTSDSVVYFHDNDHIAFVGDTIFRGSIGEYRYPGGNHDTLVKSIAERIFTLPNDTKLYSGHSAVTTVGAEKQRHGLH